MLQLTILWSPEKGIQVGGPLDNKVLCLGLLELAKAAVLRFDPAQQPETPPILIARGNLPPANGS